MMRLISGAGKTGKNGGSRRVFVLAQGQGVKLSRIESNLGQPLCRGREVKAYEDLVFVLLLLLSENRAAMPLKAVPTVEDACFHCCVMTCKECCYSKFHAPSREDRRSPLLNS